MCEMIYWKVKFGQIFMSDKNTLQTLEQIPTTSKPLLQSMEVLELLNETAGRMFSIWARLHILPTLLEASASWKQLNCFRLNFNPPPPATPPKKQKKTPKQNPPKLQLSFWGRHLEWTISAWTLKVWWYYSKWQWIDNGKPLHYRNCCLCCL